MLSAVLFILKRREDYNAITHQKLGLSTGLFNSCSFVSNMLNEQGIKSAVDVAIDGHCVDRIVHQFKKEHPDHKIYVILEALWCPPYKLPILIKLHPTVTWVLRLHSEMPFIASEGIYTDYTAVYASYPTVKIAANAPRMLRETKSYLKSVYGWSSTEADNKVIYLPNYYPTDKFKMKEFKPEPGYIDISCFGAVRPMKNHLLQAMAAVEFAEEKGRKLRFHINSGRIEMKGEPVLNNLRGMFIHLADKGHELISHQWCPHEDFLKILEQIDISMQVSLTETFNIVSADAVSIGTPILTSSEMPFASKWFNANPVNSKDIVDKLHLVWNFPQINVKLNQRGIKSYDKKTIKEWIKHFKN